MKLFAVLCVLGMTLAARAQDYPKAEIFGGYNYASSDVTSPGRTNLHGWNGAATANINRWFGVKADFSGLYGSKSVGNILGAPCPLFATPLTCAHIFIHSYSDHSSSIERTSSRLLHTPFLASVTQVSVLRCRLQACRDSISGYPIRISLWLWAGVWTTTSVAGWRGGLEPITCRRDRSARPPAISGYRRESSTISEWPIPHAGR